MNTLSEEIDRSLSPPLPREGTVVSISTAHPVGGIREEEQPQQPYDEDDHSGEIREYNGVFEGPEKTLGEYDVVWSTVEHCDCINETDYHFNVTT